ncbi:hypothetical protein NXH76_15065 [Blautia schinkii]|nr:hypothetical protein [Blautia schinkii]
MTKLKNTKKGMAKKALSISLVAAMLATSNVPVWAAFDDGTTPVMTEGEAPVEDSFSAPEMGSAEDVAPLIEETEDAIVLSAGEMVALDGNVAVDASAAYGATIKPDYTGINKGTNTLQYQWQTSSDNGATWTNIAGATSENWVVTKASVEKKVRVIAYATSDGTPVTSVADLAQYGKVSATISITPMVLAQDAITVTLDTASYTFDGTAKTPAVTSVSVKESATGLPITLSSSDYEVTGYEDNTDVGTGKVTVTLKESSGYTGSGIGTFTITGITNDWIVDLSDDAAKNQYTFSGSEIVPANITVKDKAGNEVSASYYDIQPIAGSDTAVGEYVVTVKGKGAYNGIQVSSTTKIKVVPKDVKSLRVVITPATASTPTIVEVFDDAVDPDKALTEGTDYDKVLTNDGVAGAPAYATITGKNNDGLTGSGNYKGTVTVDYANASVDISAITNFTNGVKALGATFSASATFDGTKQPPIKKGVTIGPLIEGRDFTATVTEGGTDAGTMTVVFEGKGYYTGTYTSYDFKIAKFDLKDSAKYEITPAADKREFAYDPSKTALAKYDLPEPIIKIKSSNYVLVKGTDYDFETPATYGTDDITLKLIAAVGSKNVVNTAGPINVVYKQVAKNLADSDVVVPEIPTQAFLGTAVTPEVSLIYKGVTYLSDDAYDELKKASLNQQVDDTKYKKLSDEFDITYANNTAIGENTASVTISAKAKSTTDKHYTGKKVVKFSIGNATLEGGSIVNSVDKKPDLPSVGYNKADADSKKGIVLNDSQYLVLNKDGRVVDKKYYDVAFSNNKSVGTATITITGKNGYSGTLTGTYKIAQNSLPTSSLTITSTNIPYTGSEITLVKNRDYTVGGSLANLTLGTDYTLKYENNVNAGTAKVIVQGINNYYGNFTKTFTIDKVIIGINDIAVGESGYAAGKAVEPNVAITIPGTGNVLKEGTDYTVKYSPAAYNVGDDVTINITYNTNSNIAPVNVNSASVNKKLVKVTAKDLKDVTISAIKDQEVTGEQIKPAVAILNGDVQLTEGKDFEIVYGANKEIGEGTVTIKALDSNKNYTGEQTVKFNIVKKTVKVGQAMISSVDVKGNKAVVTLTGAAENATGYDYVISTVNDTKNGRVAFDKNQVATQSTFQYLPKGTYYAYLHAWARVDGKKVFGGWSNIVKFTIKATTPAQPLVTKVSAGGSTVKVTYTKVSGAKGYDIVLGSAVKKVNGESRPVEYGKLVKKITNGNTVTATFKNVPKGTYYAGLHAYNRTSENKAKVFSPWSNTKKVTVK